MRRRDGQPRRPAGYWTRERLIIVLRDEAVRLGRTPSGKDMDALGAVCAAQGCYVRVFGSIANAQRAAGLAPNPWGGGWKRSVCHRGHARTPDNLDAGGHCRACMAHWSNRQPLPRKHGVRLPRGWNRRVVRPDVAQRHSPQEMARFWGMAS